MAVEAFTGIDEYCYSVNGAWFIELKVGGI